MPAAREIRSTKSEIRNKSKIQRSKHKTEAAPDHPAPPPVLDFLLWSFVLVSDFVLRISDFHQATRGRSLP